VQTYISSSVERQRRHERDDKRKTGHGCLLDNGRKASKAIFELELPDEVPNLGTLIERHSEASVATHRAAIIIIIIVAALTLAVGY
jgi:hypothetical protein